MVEYRLEHLDKTKTWDIIAVYGTREEAQMAFDEYVADDPSSFGYVRIRPMRAWVDEAVDN